VTPSRRARFARATRGSTAPARLIRITEHYVRMDYEGEDAEPNGRSRPSSGATGRSRPSSGAKLLSRQPPPARRARVLIRDGEPDVIQEDAIPFAAMTPVDRDASVLRPLDRRPGDGHPAHQDGVAALAARQCLSREQSPHRGAGKPCNRDHLGRSAGVAAGRDRAHQDAGRLERHRASRHRRSRVPVAAISRCHARMAQRRVAAGAGGSTPNALQNQVATIAQPECSMPPRPR